MKFSGIIVEGKSYRYLIELPFHEGVMFRITVTTDLGAVVDVIQKRFTPQQFAEFRPYFDRALRKVAELVSRS